MSENSAIRHLKGHWSIIGKDADAPSGQRFHVRQEAVKLDPAELAIAKRYLTQAVKSVNRRQDPGTTVDVPDGDARERLTDLPEAGKRQRALSKIVADLCMRMNQLGTPNPGIVFGLAYRSAGGPGAALIKADLNQKQLAQLTETEDTEGRLHLSEAEDIIEEPQSEFAKVLFQPAPYDASVQYAVLDRKAAKSRSAAYFLRALGVQTASSAGTLRRVVDAVAKEATPDKKATTIDRVLTATEDERRAAPDQPIPLERLAEAVPEAAPAIEKLLRQEPTRVTAVGAEDRVTRVWSLKEPAFKLEADSRIEVTEPQRVEGLWQMTIKLPEEPARDR